MGKSIEKEQELVAFRLWIKSLSRDDLFRAMQYNFVRDQDDAVEFTLLQQLLKAQSPVTVPIHPRAVGYRPFATSAGATDGRNEEECILKNRFKKPRLFQLSERRSMGFKKKRSRIRRYDVIARNKVTPSGDVLGLGCTKEQQDADEWILKATQLHRDTRCCCYSDSDSNPDDMRRMLVVVSRGHFLKETTMIGEDVLWTSWLQPTERWFSLPMYLASRFEVALWSAFRGHVLPPLMTPIRDAEKHLSDETMVVAEQLAVVRALSKTILPLDQRGFPLFRDGLLYNTLEEGLNLSTNASMLDLTPLLELGTYRDKFRILVRTNLEEELVIKIQHDLLSLDAKEEKPAVKKSKRKKGKKKRRQRSSKGEPAAREEEASRSLSPDTSTTYLHVRFEDSEPPSMEQTRKILIARSVIEDVVEGVFIKVGLPATPPFVEEVTKTEKSPVPTTKVINKASQRKVKDKINRADLSPNPFLSSEPSLPLPHEFVPSQTVHHDVMSMLDQDRAKTNVNPFHHRNELDLHGFSYAAPIEVSWTFEDDRLDRLMNYPSREKSMFAGFFEHEEHADGAGNQTQVASSTAASIASSTDKEPDAVEDQEVSSGDQDFLSEGVPKAMPEEVLVSHVADLIVEKAHSSSPNLDSERFAVREESMSNSASRIDHTLVSPSKSPPSPQPPRTPSPQLSPILVSLADLKNMRERPPSLGGQRDFPEFRKKSYSAGSLPSSPVQTASNTLTQSWSRDDLRIHSFTNDQPKKKASARKGGQKVASAVSYRDAAIKPTPKSANAAKKDRITGTLGYESLVPTRGLFIPYLDRNATEKEVDACVRSETALEAHRDDEQWHTPPEKARGDHAHVENITTTKDESTTVSALSPRDPDELVALRDERNTFRDMCLTLGAEVAKLKNLLAAQNGTHMQHHGHDYYAAHAPIYNPEFMRPYAHDRMRATTTTGAMSDAGIHRLDYDSAMSEDFDNALHDSSGKPRSVARRLSGGHTAAGSDLSLDQHMGTQHKTPNIRPVHFDNVGSDLEAGAHSRLTKDIIKFLKTNTIQLRKAESRRTSSVQRLSRLVTALWPRAQVKLYGSHVTGLSLPSSDLDFVVCLPAVHKNAPAITPGALEGRNAVNESSQKLLARRLKGESWIDPRSIKIIERTVVPIIKVSTKDTRARMQHLDISFDGPVHHGLEAIEMVNDILQQLPMVRPLVLLLKQFLLDRGLLIAYTGGLSSYCLFLMVTRYLQEQPSSWGDCGSLLMGFLDFYGNAFDPRATGISVRRRLYFGRRAPTVPPDAYQTPIVPATPPSAPPPLSLGKPDFLRRHSFTDKGNLDSNWNRPPRHHPPAHVPPTAPPHTRFPHPAYVDNSNAHSGKPYTFDPLWVEDPLAAGNNVGRNAFRIFQVQRAFSDAHRALVASLEWENGSNEAVEDYPLLKCLLQSEDVFYDLDDHHR